MPSLESRTPRRAGLRGPPCHRCRLGQANWAPCSAPSERPWIQYAKQSAQSPPSTVLRAAVFLINPKGGGGGGVPCWHPPLARAGWQRLNLARSTMHALHTIIIQVAIAYFIVGILCERAFRGWKKEIRLRAPAGFRFCRLAGPVSGGGSRGPGRPGMGFLRSQTASLDWCDPESDPAVDNAHVAARQEQATQRNPVLPVPDRDLDAASIDTGRSGMTSSSDALISDMASDMLHPRISMFV